MSKKVATKVFSAIMVTALAVSANVSGYMGGFDDDRAHVNLNVGSKMISPGDKFNFNDGDGALNYDVEVMRSQIQFGLDVDYKLDILPFHVAVGYHASSSEKGNHKLGLSELRLGARKYQDFDMFSIYYGGGLSSVSAKLERDKYLLTAEVSGQTAAAQQDAALDQYKWEAKDAVDSIAADATDTQKATLRSSITSAANYVAVKTIVDNLGGGTAQDGVTLTQDADKQLFTNLAARFTYTDIAAVPAKYVDAVSETASTLGFYGEVGGLYNVTEAIYVGANLTYTSATVEFEKFNMDTEGKYKKEKMDVGGAQIGLVVGYAF